MPQSFGPWCMNTRFFLTFFQENPLALRKFCAALLSIPDSQITACHLRSPAFPDENNPLSVSASCSLSVTLYCPQSLHLDIFPPVSSVSFPNPHEHFISLLPSSFPLIPPTSFLKIHLLYPQQPRPFPPLLSFYSELSSSSRLCTSRFLNLSPHTPPLLHTPLYDFFRLFLIRHSSELPTRISPSLSSILPRLEEYLHNQELNMLFQQKTPFSSTEGIQTMCSLNRLLLKEKRISELWEASRNPEVLVELFREYRKKGYL